MVGMIARGSGRQVRALYFPAITTLLLGLSILAFADNLFTDIHQPSNSDPKMVVHGLIALAWVTLFAAQAWLVNVRRIAVHRTLGQTAFVIAVAMSASTFYLFYVKFSGWAAMSPEVLANRLLLPVFVVCIVLAYVRRTRPDWHKRLLLIGTMALLEPILARTYDPTFGRLVPLGISKALDTALFLTFLFGTWAALVGSLWFYDRITLRRVHPVTLAGSAAIVAINAFAYLR